MVKFKTLLLLAMMFSGAAALMYEVIASEALFYFFTNNTYSVATVLTVFLLGLAVGGFTMGKIIRKVKNRRLVFVSLQVLIAIYALFFLSNFEIIPKILGFIYTFAGNNEILLVLSKFAVGNLYLFFPTFLLGAIFPLASSLLIKDVKKVGSGIGSLYSLNNFGAIAGSWIAGFILLPLFGLKLSIFIGAVLNLISGFLVLKKNRKSVFLFIVISLLLISLFFLVNNPFQNSDEIIVNTNSKVSKGVIYLGYESLPYIFLKNSPYGEIAVTDDNNTLRLFIDRRQQCNSASVSERKISDTALKNFDRDVKVLNIGLGCGITLSSILKYDIVKEVDVVEINPVMPQATSYFSRDNNNALKDDRVNLIIDDGAHYLETTNKNYDVVIIDVENPAVAHSSPLYTVEWFEIINNSLNEDGVLALWGFMVNYEYIKTLYKSIDEVFPYTYYISESVAYVGSKQELDEENIGMTEEDIKIVEMINNDNSYILNTMNYPVLKYKYLRK